MNIESEYVSGFLIGILIIGVLANFVRILFPNYSIKQYMSHKWNMPNDNKTRFWSIAFLLINTYVLLYVLGYIK